PLGEYADAAGEPMARKNAATSAPPTLPRNAASGGNVTMRQIDPRGGGSMRCGSAGASRACLILTGVASVTQTRVETNPGRAGSVRTSRTGPSSIATDFPPASSMVTIRRTGFGPSVIDAIPCPRCDLKFARVHSSNFAPIITKAIRLGAEGLVQP